MLNYVLVERIISSVVIFHCCIFKLIFPPFLSKPNYAFFLLLIKDITCCWANSIKFLPVCFQSSAPSASHCQTEGDPEVSRGRWIKVNKLPQCLSPDWLMQHWGRECVQGLCQDKVTTAIEFFCWKHENSEQRCKLGLYISKYVCSCVCILMWSIFKCPLDQWAVKIRLFFSTQNAFYSFYCKYTVNPL